MYAPLAKVVSLLKPKRRWFQFSLLTMFAVVTVFGVWLGHWVDPISKLCRQLHDESADVREEAAKRLGQMGSKARAAESSLVDALKDENSSVRSEAAEALSRIGGDWRALVPLLDDEDADVQLSAAKGIVHSGGDFRLVVFKLLDHAFDDGNWGIAEFHPNLGPDPTLAAVPLLIDAVAGHDAALKEAAHEILREYLPVPPISAVPLLIEYLAHSSPDARIAAAEQLLRLGTDARQAAGPLRERLHDPDRRVALAMAAALGAVDSADREFLALLVESLRADDEELRDRALTYCAALGPRAAGVAGELPMLFDEDPNDEWYTVHDDFHVYLHPVLEHIGPAVLPLLRAILSRGSRSARLRAAVAIVELGPRVRCQAPELVPALTALLDDLDNLDNMEQWDAMRALGEIGKDAAPVVPRLVKLIQSGADDDNRTRSIEALRKIGVFDETTRTELTAALGGSRPADRLLAARMLAAGGVSAGVVLPTFVELAQDDDLRIATHSLGLLADSRLGPAAAPAMDFLLAQLTTENQRGYRDVFAADVLGQIGPVAVGRLIEVLDHPRPRTRALAAKALGEMEPAANGAVPRLIGLLEDGAGQLGDWGWSNEGWLAPFGRLYGVEMTVRFQWGDPIYVRDVAVIALGVIGPESRSAVPALVRLLEEPLGEYTGFHRSFAAWSLGRIGPDALPAVPALIRFANLHNERPEATAAMALARIDPENTATIACLKRYLEASTHRAAAFFEDERGEVWISDDFLDVIWELGSRAEPLVADLHMVLDAPLLDNDHRCRAAYALASFPAERASAVRYLELAAAHHKWNFAAAELLEKLKASHTNPRRKQGR
ncbi:MAG TPA: HEAT repeat domain-containing protein [Pirellulales bacterium]|nr:HEAT repeat domain-containing protein [Pirellulales bacterium]